ncbi:MAG: glutamine--fructose-6-phosphate transaminase (isomerizing) [Wenzhouxiangellaceae bacterium]
MCGIVAATAQRDISGILLNGLGTLEYRGYDSAGLAVLDDDQQLRRLRTVGKVAELKQLYDARPVSGRCGIAHTRWATHGIPSTPNAHPHLSAGGVALVHNGIIENHAALRAELQQAGFSFSSDTDSEVMVHLIEHVLAQGHDLFAAVRAACDRLHGAYAIAVISQHEPDCIVGARRGSPLVLGIGFGEHFLASDVHPLIAVTNRFVFLEEGDVVRLDREQYQIVDAAGATVERPVKESELNPDAIGRGGYRHYMQKEIFEQPAAVAETLEGRVHHGQLLPELCGAGSDALLQQVEQVHIVACGTSYHAGLVCRYQLEQLAGLPCVVEVASEYRYRQPVVPANTLLVVISQSGETADTLAALRYAGNAGYLARLAICNVPESSLVREAEWCLMTRAGPEIGVASTKAFITQLTALHLLTLTLARHQGLQDDVLRQRVIALEHLPEALQQALQQDDAIKQLAEQLIERHHALFLGRGSHYPIALEGALKLKEISYIHAEAYPAGELKHGPLALVDSDMPVVVVAPQDALMDKMLSNLEEVRARGGQLIVIGASDVPVPATPGLHRLTVAADDHWLSPMVMTVPLQLLAYHTAVLKGTDVDQPRNLAKSVTVE